MRWRYAAFIVILFAMFAYLASGLVSLQLESSEIYAEKAQNSSTKTIKLRGKRGSIISSDSVTLAEDEYIYNVTFYKDPSQVSATHYKTFTASIIDTIEIVERNGGKMAIDFVIERDPETGEWRFNFGSGVSEKVLQTRETQWRSNNYLPVTKYPTAADCMVKLTERYQFPEGIDEGLMLKVMAIYSEMQMNVFNSQPIVIAKNVSYETVIEIETRSMTLSGMEIAVGTQRVYPRHTLAAQVIGYIGAIPSQSMWSTLQGKGYQYSDTIGRDGIESSMEDWLTQNSSLRQGSRVVERDQQSRVVRELSYTAPQDGNNVKLTLNAGAQTVAERAIADNVNTTRTVQEKYVVNDDWLEANKEEIATRNWEKFPLKLAEHGCMVVLDMDCRVIAIANYPTYDLNALVAGGDEAISILSDERGLLLNYGIHARGTPGSIFKMVTAMGALIEGEFKLNERISDGGYYTQYNKDEATAPKCWIGINSIGKHANQTIVDGLANSCNYFFYTLADRLGEERLYRYASMFGLTSKTGIDLPGEVRSIVGSQNTLYDTTKPMDESNQDTSMPIIVFNAIKSHLKNQGEIRNMHYDDERLSVCAKRLMDMAVNYPESVWTENMRIILMEELGMSREVVNLAAVITDPYLYMNSIKWGGAQTILTGIGQSVTMITPVAAARYVCALANGGKVYNVSIIDSIISPDGEILSQREPMLINTIPDAELYLPSIWKGMAKVVDESGTAQKYFKNWEYLDRIAAKTGTAQVTDIDLENNAWFVAFAPIEAPEIAIAVFIPNGYSGGEASLAAKQFVQWWLDQAELRSIDYDLPPGNALAP